MKICSNSNTLKRQHVVRTKLLCIFSDVVKCTNSSNLYHVSILYINTAFGKLESGIHDIFSH